MFIAHDNGGGLGPVHIVNGNGLFSQVGSVNGNAIPVQGLLQLLKTAVTLNINPFFG